ncbi:MAG TPA: Gfo/Idh/MocA family oxidoreductase [Pirellulaceae bacterium]|nr:Gfo/Idh/MocA family oxidoreductase [Pirellulaceae bacterium]
MARTNRRQFIQTSAVIGAGYFVASGLQAQESKSPNEKINFACIGVMGKGQSDSQDAADSGNIVAICDVDDTHLNRAAARKGFEKAAKYFDYRKMLDEMGKSIDAVTVSTPDHTHAVAAAMAMNMGKHCFTQKPLTHSIYEARTLGKIATARKVATQMGNQGTANNDLRRAAAIIQSGVLGKITAVHVWTNRPVWPQGLDRPTDTPPVPATLHWNEWLGPAKERPYHPAYHPFKWRGWWDFGTGALGDMACHTLNMPYMALSLRDPVSVVAESAGHNKETYPSWSIIKFEFPANDKRGPVAFTWYDGQKRPDADLLKGAKETSGCLVVGEKDTLYAPGDYAGAGLKLQSGAELPEVDYKRSPGHFKEFVNAIRGGEAAMSNFPNYAGPLTETILLGNLAVWATGKKIEWDPKNLVAKNAPEVAHIIKTEYRDGYSLGDVS